MTSTDSLIQLLIATLRTRPTDSRASTNASVPFAFSAFTGLLIVILLWKRFLLHCCMEHFCFHCYQHTQLFSLLCDRTVTLPWNCNNPAPSIVTATPTLLGQGNLTYATPPRKPNMSQYNLHWRCQYSYRLHWQQKHIRLWEWPWSQVCGWSSGCGQTNRMKNKYATKFSFKIKRA
jgi:hypothetical protein